VGYASNLSSFRSRALDQRIAKDLAPRASAPADEIKKFDVIVLPDSTFDENSLHSPVWMCIQTAQDTNLTGWASAKRLSG
jgi:hypothetical protein